MIDTFQALAVVVLAILPGASYMFRLRKGRWLLRPERRGPPDPVPGSVRRAADSLLRADLLPVPEVYTDRQVARAELDWRWVWTAVALYVLVPTAIGLLPVSGISVGGVGCGG